MTVGYSVEICKELEERLRNAALTRPMNVRRYDAGTELVYHVAGMNGTNRARVRVVVEEFVGGGFAGQVYRVKILDVSFETEQIAGLEVGGLCAMKILIPPTTFSRFFRNALYWIGFQGSFQLQVNPAAARAGALWQKFIRRGAKTRFGDETTVVDIYATLVDTALGSCGELSEWIDGRTWQLEVDDRMDLLKRWKMDTHDDSEGFGSPEYRAKYRFMHEFVELLHEMGCPEFARQYEWSTCKSQPNCLKRNAMEGHAFDGLVAVDFRAGLALLPFLPLSPGDFRLILEGFKRRSLVQFDRGDIGTLEQFVDKHSGEFADTKPLLKELRETEEVYRDSVPDITHNGFRLLYSSKLWSTMLDSALGGWKVRNLLDERSEKRLRQSRALTTLFFLIGIVPLLGRFLRRIYGREDWRKHYVHMITSWNYLKRAVKAKALEMLIDWHRAGRVDDDHALKLSEQLWPLLYHVPLSILPAGLHRFMTDWQYAKARLAHLVVRPVRLYFNAEAREEWLREMVTEGKEKNLLNDEDAEVILSQIHEPFIQKYLKSLAVHVCTLPVTQIVSVLVAITYVLMHPEMPRGQAWGIGLGIIALFQVVPISPGSLVRGLYVVYLVIRDRNFKDYNIAVFLGFFKYIGYLAFPIQMTYRYPTLARFMAAHWATEAVHMVPVFGERGALLEHGVFCLFYNWPLTIRRRMQKWAHIRATMSPRYWHVTLYAILGSAVFGIVDFACLKVLGELPGLKQTWWLALVVPMLCGTMVTVGAGGAPFGKRIAGAAVCGALMAVFYTAAFSIAGHGATMAFADTAIALLWRLFLFTILSTIGGLVTELKLPEPSVSGKASDAASGTATSD
jgi:hypothetical protein